MKFTKRVGGHMGVNLRFDYHVRDHEMVDALTYYLGEYLRYDDDLRENPSRRRFIEWFRGEMYYRARTFLNYTVFDDISEERVRNWKPVAEELFKKWFV